jgi:hypothetical protein
MSADTETSANKFLPWFVAFFAMHLAMRVAAVLDGLDTLFFAGAEPWLRGVASDALVALVLAFFSTWLGNKRKWLPGAFFLFWSVAMAGNREYIGEWAANISLLDIAGLLNPEFLEGSVLTVRLFLTAGILASVGLAAYMATQFVGGAVVLPRRVRQGLALLPLLIFIWPASPPQLWIQQNIVEENLHQFVQMLTPDRSNLSPGWVLEARRLLIASQKPDLQGELFVTPQPDANVIIINIESLSDNILQRGWMPYLKKLADNNLYYSYYILPNLTTIRGLYAQFCGRVNLLGQVWPG